MDDGVLDSKLGVPSFGLVGWSSVRGMFSKLCELNC